MRQPFLEHVNITVSDPKRTAELLCSLFGWEIRWSGPAIDDGVTYHVGTEEGYVALYAPKNVHLKAPNGYVHIGGFNHIGVVVDDIKATEKRVSDAGFTPHNHGDYEPGRRFYFDDWDGVEYEVVSYS
ncbi:MAG: VOC family protein [Pseudomonadota bacterium]